MVIELHQAQIGGQLLGVDDIRDLILSLGFMTVARHGPVYVFARKSSA